MCLNAIEKNLVNMVQRSPVSCMQPRSPGLQTVPYSNFSADGRITAPIVQLIPSMEDSRKPHDNVDLNERRGYWGPRAHRGFFHRDAGDSRPSRVRCPHADLEKIPSRTRHPSAPAHRPGRAMGVTELRRGHAAERRPPGVHPARDPRAAEAGRLPGLMTSPPGPRPSRGEPHFRETRQHDGKSRPR